MGAIARLMRGVSPHRQRRGHRDVAEGLLLCSQFPVPDHFIIPAERAALPLLVAGRRRAGERGVASMTPALRRAGSTQVRVSALRWMHEPHPQARPPAGRRQARLGARHHVLRHADVYGADSRRDSRRSPARGQHTAPAGHRHQVRHRLRRMEPAYQYKAYDSRGLRQGQLRGLARRLQTSTSTSTAPPLTT